MDVLQYRLYEKRDYDRIISLLSNNDLPVSDLRSSIAEFIVTVDKGNLVGCIGIEHYEKDGLLRSLAVDLNYRNKGIGTQLLQRLLAYCRQLDIDNIHLLTTTAEKYFLSKGFVKSNRDEAPKSIIATTEFSSICPSSSTYMTLKQINKRAFLYTDEVKILQIDKETQSKYWAVNGEKLMFTYFEVPPNKTFQEHAHESEQITYVMEGTLFFQISDEVFCVGSGDCIVIPSNIPHKVWSTENQVKAVDAWTPINDKYK
jgi:amino-acid N-acetyltransferase